ncbi:MAG: FHA domain-containing protein FhaB/FipA [Rhodoglobus sp.]
MSELTLLILRIAFLVLLWAFVFAIVYAVRSDLFGQAGGGVPATPAVASLALTETPAPEATPTGSLTARRLVITSGARSGLEMDLPDDAMSIGRSADCGLVIRDDYTSTHHARLLLWDVGWVIQDLESTNGTFLNGTRVLVPTQVPLNTPVKIGTTSFELRR